MSSQSNALMSSSKAVVRARYAQFRDLIFISRYIPAFFILIIGYTITQTVILAESQSINKHALSVLDAIHDAPLTVSGGGQQQQQSEGQSNVTTTFTVGASSTSSSVDPQRTGREREDREKQRQGPVPDGGDKDDDSDEEDEGEVVRNTPAAAPTARPSAAAGAIARPTPSTSSEFENESDSDSDSDSDSESEAEAETEAKEAELRTANRILANAKSGSSYRRRRRLPAAPDSRQGIAQHRHRERSSASSSRIRSHGKLSRREQLRDVGSNRTSVPRPAERYFDPASSQALGSDLARRTLSISVTEVRASASSSNNGSEPVGSRSFVITGLSDSGRALVVSEACSAALGGPVAWIRSKTIQDLTFIFFRLWMAILGFLAIFQESVPHLAAFVIGDVAGMGWGVANVVITKTFHDRFHDDILAGTCEGSSMLPGYWSEVLRMEIALCVINFVAFCILAFVVLKLVKILNWMTFERLGASFEVKVANRFMLFFHIALQSAVFFVLAFQVIWLAEICSHDDHNLQNYKIALGALTALTAPWLALGWFGTRKESKACMAVFLMFNLVLLGNFAFLFSQQMRVLASAVALWRFMLFLGSMAIILGSATLILGVICVMHFGNGLLQQRNRDVADDRSINSYLDAQAYNEKRLQLDGDYATIRTTKTGLTRSGSSASTTSTVSSASTIRAMAQANRALALHRSRSGQLSPSEADARPLSMTEAEAAVMVQIAPRPPLPAALAERRDPAEIAATQARQVSAGRKSCSNESEMTFDSGNPHSPEPSLRRLDSGLVGRRVEMQRRDSRASLASTVQSDMFSMLSRQDTIPSDRSESRNDLTSPRPLLSRSDSSTAARSIQPAPYQAIKPRLAPLEISRWSATTKSSEPTATSRTTSVSGMSYGTGDPASRPQTPSRPSSRTSTRSGRNANGGSGGTPKMEVPALPPLDLARWSGLMNGSMGARQ